MTPGRRPPTPALWLIPLLLTLWTTACGDPGVAEARITSFDPPSGTLGNGEPATSSVRFENVGDEERTFWVGYSVRDSAGRWHHAPARPVSLDPGGESGGEELTTGLLATAGPYEARVSVWDVRPGSDGATRLANAERQDAFVVAEAEDLRSRDDFDSLNEDRWSVTSKRLGRGRLKTGNVAAEDGKLRIRLPAGTLQGGEIESADSYGYGSYAARIKAARAPSSLTGFFLYAPPDFHTEIDVEIFNDRSGRVMFTTYADGKQTNTVEKNLPFDPTAGFHEYRMDLYPTGAEFSVDGRLLHTFRDGIPGDSMKLMVNAWYPTWLPGKEPRDDGHTYVDWIQR